MATLLTNTGKAIVTNYLNGGAATQPKYIAWGTGAGTTASTDTTLFTETGTRVAGTTSQQTTTTTNDTFQVIGTLTNTGGTTTYTNAGTFDALTSGNLFIKGDFTGISLNTSDSIQFTVKVQFS
jgi:hypothetical protein